nr:EOG090X0MUO [Lepidurus arcticus]
MLLSKVTGRLRNVSSLLKNPSTIQVATPKFLADLTQVRAEPEYLDDLGPQIPIYGTLDIQLKSYDFPVLESFMSFVHRTADNMGVEVEDCWATPGRSLNVQTFKPQSTLILSQYALQQYERNIQVLDPPSTLVPLLIEVIQQTLPPGVDLCVKEHLKTDDDVRYVPDLQLKEMRTQLDAMGGPTTSKKKS